MTAMGIETIGRVAQFLLLAFFVWLIIQMWRER